MFNARIVLVAASLLPAALAAQSGARRADSTCVDSSANRHTGPSAQSLMDGYVAEAIGRNLALAQQTLAEKRSEFGVREATGRMLPSLGLNARYTEYSGVINIGDFVNPTYQTLNQILGEQRFPTDINATLPMRQETKFALTLPIYNAALLGNRERAVAIRNAKGAERRIVMRQLTADIQLAWIGVASAAQVVKSLRATLPVLDENLRVSERLVASGQSTVDAAYRGRAERSELLQQIVEAEQREAAARRVFNQLRNREPDAPVIVADDSSLISPTIVAANDAIQTALRSREELDAADEVISIASAERRIATSAWKPSIALAADYGVQGDRYQFDRKHDVATASLVVSWNVFNGGQDAARKSQASIARDEAELGRRLAEQQIRTQVATTYDALIAQRSALSAANDRFESARRSFTLIERRYAEGLAPHVEYLVARTALTNATINQVLTRYSYAARRVEFERAAALRSLSGN